MISSIKKPNFNSIKVRLKLAGDYESEAAEILFQFHKGTIETALEPIGKHEEYLFQFHKGTIETHRLAITRQYHRISIP